MNWDVNVLNTLSSSKFKQHNTINTMLLSTRGPFEKYSELWEEIFKWSFLLNFGATLYVMSDRSMQKPHYVVMDKCIQYTPCQLCLLIIFVCEISSQLEWIAFQTDKYNCPCNYRGGLVWEHGNLWEMGWDELSTLSGC